jgi:raffinose/stachyose/melibiose transport system permease protein
VVLNAVFIWNDFYAPLLYLSGSGHATLPVAEYQFTGQYNSDWNLVFAALLLGAIPIVVTFLVMQKATFRGYMSGLK